MPSMSVTASRLLRSISHHRATLVTTAHAFLTLRRYATEGRTAA
jgi:hypothetical protein